MAESQRFYPGNNRAVIDHGRERHYVLHRTSIVVVDNEAGTIALHSGGWETATTKRAMNQVSSQYGFGFRVYSDGGEWKVDWKGETYTFQNGMILP